jgi:DNA sulfur modification protein DndD
VQQLADTVECAVRDLQAVARDLARVPSEERLRPYLSQLNSLYLELGASQEQLARLQEKLAVATRERDELVRTHTAEVEAIGQRQDLADRLELVRKVQASLSDYYARLTATRLRELGDEVTRCFNRLSRKGDMVKSIDISADTFGIRLEDTRGREIPKAALSAGEKQILAIALLWGLARVSRRPLPVIIDTPLGRLDSEHRRLLLEEYLPHASHQVIVLSTDTEVDRELFPIVAPAVARCYHLEYDRLTASTQPKAGYFWTS